MATRSVSPTLLHSLRHSIRRLNSSPSSIAAVAPLNLTEKAEPTLLKPPTNTATIDFDDVSRLFASVSSTKLLRSSANLHMAAMDPMVDFGMWVMRSRLMDTALFREIILGTIKHTFFEHFCAGEDAKEAGQSVQKLWDTGLRGMLVYGVEHTDDNESCDRNLEGFLATAESTKSLPSSSVSFIIVKITAICPMRLLMRVSDLLRWEYKDPSFRLPWKRNTFPLFAESSPLYHTLEKPDPLTPQEEHELELGLQRLEKLCQTCLEANVPLSIDAEDTIVQPAIDYFTYFSAINYNKYNNPIVYGTIQAYLKDAKERLLLAATAAEKIGVPMGFKLVRGAYMSSERKLASSLGFESPIHNSIEDTHACFNDCASFILDKIAKGSCAAVLATHNVESGKMAAVKARDLGIGPDNEKLQFAQLFGMSEALSFGLKNAGFIVNKYMPYGPIDLVMPYLLRRAEENRGLLSSSTVDRHLMRKELKRRLKEAIF